MTKHYLALTIGPMSRTLHATRSTRAIWSASYLFSWIMRQLVEKLRDEKDVHFISPFNGRSNGTDFCDDTPRGVGLFHDRIIIEADSPQMENLNKHIESTINDLVKKLKLQDDEVKDIKIYLNNYLQFHKIELENTNFTEISNLLDTIECQSAFVQQETQPYLTDFFEFLAKGEYNAFIKEQFVVDGRFPSTPEIATADLAITQPEKYENAIKVLRENEEALYSKTHEKRLIEKRRLELRQHEIDAQIKFYNEIAQCQAARHRHKYMAIVLADGDNMGKLIQSIQAYYEKNDPEKPQSERFKGFSAQLMVFTAQASEEIKKFGGTPIYAGGDDLLFFSPLVGKEGKSFLTLLSGIDTLFNQYIAENEEFSKFFDFKINGEDTKKPSMSYGVSITYYKFPLGETHEQATNLLYSKTKTGNKHKIAFDVQKHSGAQFGGVFERGKDSYKHFKELVENRLQDDDKGEKLINSIGHKLQSLEGVLKGIVKDKAKIDEQLKNLFINSFNEPIHKTAAGKQYLEKVRDFMIAVLIENPNFEEEHLNIYGALRLVHFLQAPFKDKDDQHFTKTNDSTNA